MEGVAKVVQQEVDRTKTESNHLIGHKSCCTTVGAGPPVAKEQRGAPGVRTYSRERPAVGSPTIR